MWDIITDAEAIETVLNFENSEDAACRLRDIALQRGSSDNISVIVIRFKI